MEDEPKASAAEAHDAASAVSVGLSQLLEIVRAKAVKLSGANGVREILAPGLGTMERFERLVAQDPLGMRGYCAGEVKRHRLLMAPQRVFRQAAAQLAFELALARPNLKLERLAAQCVERGFNLLLSDDSLAESEGQPIAPEEQAWFELGRELFAVAPADARLCLLRFNALETEDRKFLFSRILSGLQGGARSAGELLGAALDGSDAGTPMDFARARVRKLLEGLTMRREGGS